MRSSRNSTCREKLLPRVARSAVFSRRTGPLLKPCRRPNLMSASWAKLFSMQITSLISVVKGNNLNEGIPKLYKLTPGQISTYACASTSWSTPETLHSRMYMFLYEHISPSATRLVLIQFAEPCLSPGNPGTLTSHEGENSQKAQQMMHFKHSKSLFAPLCTWGMIKKKKLYGPLKNKWSKKFHSQWSNKSALRKGLWWGLWWMFVYMRKVLIS